MVSIKILRLRQWLTGREAKALLESEIPDELDSTGKLDDEQFFLLIEEQKDWLPVFVKGCEPRIQTLSKHFKLEGMAKVIGNFLLDDERMFDEKRMYGPPDIVVELGRSNVILSCETRDGGVFSCALADGHSITVKVFFRVADILYLASRINCTEQPETSVDMVRPLQRQQTQQAAILKACKAAGYDPLKLPKFRPGKPWVKGEVWGKLKVEKSIFTSRKVFDTAWQNLRDCKEIQESE